MFFFLFLFFFFAFCDVKKILRSASHGSTESWVLHGFGRHVVRPWTVPNLGMADREFELWTGFNMGSSDLGWTRDWARQGFGRPRIGLLF